MPPSTLRRAKAKFPLDSHGAKPAKPDGAAENVVGKAKATPPGVASANLRRRFARDSRARLLGSHHVGELESVVRLVPMLAEIEAFLLFFCRDA